MRALGRVAWAWLLLLQLAGASHVVYDYENLEVEAAAAAVPPSIVDPLLRTGYHFQPRKNWINGNVNLARSTHLLPWSTSKKSLEFFRPILLFSHRGTIRQVMQIN
jgi:hypothetical protein